MEIDYHIDNNVNRLYIKINVKVVQFTRKCECYNGFMLATSVKRLLHQQSTVILMSVYISTCYVYVKVYI